jgi:hypothetical protein
MSPHSSSFLIAVITGASSSVMQSTTASPTVSMMVPILSAVVGGAVSYGILKGVVQAMERDVSQMRRDMGQMYDLLRDFSSRIGHIEGRLDDRK